MWDSNGSRTRHAHGAGSPAQIAADWQLPFCALHRLELFHSNKKQRFRRSQLISTV